MVPPTPLSIFHHQPSPITIHHYSPHGGFLKWGYPQIIHFGRNFRYKSSNWGYPHFWKPPCGSKHQKLPAPWSCRRSAASAMRCARCAARSTGLKGRSAEARACRWGSARGKLRKTRGKLGKTGGKWRKPMETLGKMGKTSRTWGNMKEH